MQHFSNWVATAMRHYRGGSLESRQIGTGLSPRRATIVVPFSLSFWPLARRASIAKAHCKLTNGKFSLSVIRQYHEAKSGCFCERILEDAGQDGLTENGRKFALGSQDNEESTFQFLPYSKKPRTNILHFEGLNSFDEENIEIGASRRSKKVKTEPKESSGTWSLQRYRVPFDDELLFFKDQVHRSYAIFGKSALQLESVLLAGSW
ncbi:hypothetical protein FXO38_16306 [Capsicum annuum]|nr:hypothetical protein FXO38_16306 [Capsicum annuum]